MVVAVMGATLVRVGNEEYASSNRSYGLTTLRNRHVQAARRGGLRFRFNGKSGKSHEVVLTDARLVCRGTYIDPSLFAAWRSGRLARHARDARGARQWEAATLRFLRARQRL